jgi:hypothetical protein
MTGTAEYISSNKYTCDDWTEKSWRKLAYTIFPNWYKYDTTGSSITDNYTTYAEPATTSATTAMTYSKAWDCYAENRYKKDCRNMLSWEYTQNIVNTAVEWYANNTDNMIRYISKGFPSWNSAPVVTPSERMRQIIQTRIAPAIHRGRKRASLSIAMDIREERARQTLRRIIGEQAFRKFIRDGFITVVPKSGLTYRIYPGHGITEVYDRGIMVDKLCVVLRGNFPPTDSLIMRYLLILNDEGEFSQHAVKHHVFASGTTLEFSAQEESLTELWAKLKVA